MASAGPPDAGLSAPPGKVKIHSLYLYTDIVHVCILSLLCCFGSVEFEQRWVHGVLIPVKPFVQPQQHEFDLILVASEFSHLIENSSDVCYLMCLGLWPLSFILK